MQQYMFQLGENKNNNDLKYSAST